MPDAITVALEDGPLNPAAPAADLTGRLERLTHPEPFTVDPESRLDGALQDDLHPNSRPNLDRGPIAW